MSIDSLINGNGIAKPDFKEIGALWGCNEKVAEMRFKKLCLYYICNTNVTDSKLPSILAKDSGDLEKQERVKERLDILDYANLQLYYFLAGNFMFIGDYCWFYTKNISKKYDKSIDDNISEQKEENILMVKRTKRNSKIDVTFSLNEYKHKDELLYNEITSHCNENSIPSTAVMKK